MREWGEFDREKGRTMREARRKVGKGGNLIGNGVGRAKNLKIDQKTGLDSSRTDDTIQNRKPKRPPSSFASVSLTSSRYFSKSKPTVFAF